MAARFRISAPRAPAARARGRLRVRRLQFPHRGVDCALSLGPLLRRASARDLEGYRRRLAALAVAAAVKYRDPREGRRELRKLFAELAARLQTELQRQALRAGRAVPADFSWIPILNAADPRELCGAADELGAWTVAQLGLLQPPPCAGAAGEILAYLREHYASELTLGRLASQVHLNASYLSRLLKKQTGRSFTQLLLEIRVEKAGELLRTTALRVYEVGERVGIENPKYFSQVFRRHTGCRPSEYRAVFSRLPVAPGGTI